MTTAQRGTLAAAILGSAIVFLDGTLVIPRPAADGRPARQHDPRAPRGPDLRHVGLPRDPRGVPRPRRRARRLLRPATDVPDRAGRVRAHLGPVRDRAEPRAARPRARAAGPRRSAPRSGLAVDHHEHVRGSGPRPRLRRLGRGHVRAGDAGTADRRHPRRRGGLARPVPDQRAARPHRAGRDALHERITRRDRDRPLRLARRRRGRPRGRWTGVRGDPRAAAAVGGPDRVRGARDRSGGPRRLPDPDGPPEAPARPARAVPGASVRHDQPVDAADLRRPVRERRLPGAVPAERARLHATGRGDRRDPDRDPADAAVDPGRDRSPGGSASGRSSSRGRS